MSDSVQAFRHLIADAVERLSRLEPAGTAVRPPTGGWSPKEILGHLIDSASNNHARFVRAQIEDDLLFPGYDQDSWVAVQQYQSADWVGLVDLWRAFNLHLAHVMAAVSEDARHRLRYRHSPDAVAFRPVPADQPTTLQYLMEDYIRHLRHHLDQITRALPHATK